ncbi:hypothetical protein CC80DRAFT_143381 [Byssothecium circinans]|uniref:Uncharacterized protein n=1 Tax=Byssothecium circinans TaxID=147558 RepID=A0A6A5TN63_9PLEO|nr:hypothetical protein CC80DRAFT_143381 [Byssothecium circinans]
MHDSHYSRSPGTRHRCDVEFGRLEESSRGRIDLVLAGAAVARIALAGAGAGVAVATIRQPNKRTFPPRPGRGENIPGRHDDVE